MRLEVILLAYDSVAQAVSVSRPPLERLSFDDKQSLFCGG
jgi:hypothetical protein